MTAAMLGAGALLLASAELFTILRIIGGAYLVWLGVRTWRSAGSQWALEPTAGSPRRVFSESFAVTATNPKASRSSSPSSRSSSTRRDRGFRRSPP